MRFWETQSGVWRAHTHVHTLMLHTHKFQWHTHKLVEQIYCELYGAYIYVYISVHTFVVHVDANIKKEEDFAMPTEYRSTWLKQMTSEVISFTSSKDVYSNISCYYH